MWFLTGVLVSLCICETLSQGQRFGDRGGLPQSDGFGGGSRGTDVMVRNRGEGFGPGGPSGGGGGFGAGSGGSGGQVPAVGECPRDRRIDGFRCYGRGMDVTDCPSGSTCMRDGTSGGSFCCWDSSSPVQSPCDDPLMQGGTFADCTPGDTQRSCPGSCHTCRALGGGMSTGLCCPEVNRQGCESSSPMRNEFEAARRRITGGSGSTSTGSSSMDTGSQFRDRGMTGNFPGDQVGQRPAPLGTDFGMTSGSISDSDGRRVLCPNGFPPVQSCSATTPCSFGQDCLEISAGRGGCCSSGSQRAPAGRRDMASGRSGAVCPDGGPGIDRCYASTPCGPGRSCIPTGGDEGICCPSGSDGRGRSMAGITGGPGSGAFTRPGMPAITGMRGGPAGVGPGMPGRPGGMSAMPGMPGDMGGFGPGVMGRPGMPAMPGMPPAAGMFRPGAMGRPGGFPMATDRSGGRIPFGLLSRRREMMRRALARRRMLGSRPPFARGAGF